MIDIKPATNEILNGFFPTYPSMRAWVAVEDERCLGVTGSYLNEDKIVIFADITEELRKRREFKRIVAKAYKLVIKSLKNTKLPVYASACPFTPGSEVLLKHMGFKRHDRNIFKWAR